MAEGASLPANDAMALLRTAAARHEAGAFAEALTLYRQILEHRPDLHNVWARLASTQRSLGHYESAVVACKRALLLAPKNGGYWRNLGNALTDLYRLEEALRAYDKSDAIEPKSPGTLFQRGIAHCEAGNLKEALHDFEAAIRLNPNYPDYRWNRAVVLLQMGRLKEGLVAYEWRNRRPGVPPRPEAVPRWLGEAIPGKRLLLYPEQGFGDTILAARFLKGVKAASQAHVTLATEPALLRLFDGLEGADRIHPSTEPLPAMDYTASLLDLPRLLRIDESGPPPPARLSIPRKAIEKMQALLKPAEGRFTLGIVWSGNVKFGKNPQRSAPLARFLRLGEVPGVQLVSLQKGVPEQDLTKTGGEGVAIDIGRRARDFAETAAAIAQLDLVVMTDSAVAHLTGSLGTPIWNLLSYRAYWIYGTGRADCPWYPSMRLFRQPKPLDWDPVFAAVETALKEAVAAKKAGAWPPRFTIPTR